MSYLENILPISMLIALIIFFISLFIVFFYDKIKINQISENFSIYECGADQIGSIKSSIYFYFFFYRLVIIFIIFEIEIVLLILAFPLISIFNSISLEFLIIFMLIVQFSIIFEVISGATRLFKK